ncbi:MAG: type II secretion system F family protein [Vallitaleaceae bacterium]|nr:type II secretion system F family protein [Vallitaleaceae bacterium]
MNYLIYTMTGIEKIKYGLMGMVVAFIFAMLFYGNVLIALLFSIGGIYYVPTKRKQLIVERKKKLKQQFKEALYALSSSISVGKSIESAFVDARNDLKVIYWDDQTYILQELEVIVRKIAMNETIESALSDFAIRAGDEDIQNFTNVFITAKRSGGNLVEVMKVTTSSINEKIEIMDAIEVLITGKKYEQRILGLLVPFIIVYLHLFSSGFMDVMYKTLLGKIAMTIALSAYVVSLVIGKKIVDIEV